MDINDNNCSIKCEKLYDELIKNKVDIFYDDRDVSVGKKFSDNDLIGFPYQIIIGPKGLSANLLEIKDRKTDQITKLSFDETINFIVNQFNNN